MFVTYLQSRGPLVLEHVEADAAQTVNVGVVERGQKAHLGGAHGVVFGQKELQAEHPALKGGFRRPGNHHCKVARVVGENRAEESRSKFWELFSGYFKLVRE
jgi:hypothetical protein